MRKIILMMSVSVDGFIEGPDRELDWHLVDDELHRHFNEQLSAMGAFLNGRVTYELMARFWPTADTDPSSTGPSQPGWGKMFMNPALVQGLPPLRHPGLPQAKGAYEWRWIVSSGTRPPIRAPPFERALTLLERSRRRISRDGEAFIRPGTDRP
ncbi:MAG: hypothetical protein DMF81_26495, partial [Acidobacteria bacterium]